MAIVLQALCVKLGVATGRDLAQACRDNYSPRVSFFLWILCEIAIAACDSAELVCSAIALELLFGIPLAIGVCITALDVIMVKMNKPKYELGDRSFQISEYEENILLYQFSMKLHLIKRI